MCPVRAPLRRFLVLALAAAPLAACGGPAASRPPPLPGVVVLCIDTLRLDAVGPAMPFLSQWAAQATTFEDACAPAPWTPPSVASLLTGLRPTRHGVRGDLDVPTMPEGVPTLAEALRRAGWTTAASTAGGWVVSEQGLLRGFDSGDGRFDSDGPEAVVARWDAARDRSRPFFLFLHTNAAHDPYGDKGPWHRGVRDRPPEVAPLAARIGRALDGGAKVLSPDLYDEMFVAHLSSPMARFALREAVGIARYDHLWRTGAYLWFDEGWRLGADGGGSVSDRLAAAYEGGLPHADDLASRTFAALAKCGLPEGTAYFVVGDHGESFGERGVLYHGLTLEEGVLRVPFFARAKGRLEPGARVRGSCSLVDVAPTVLEWAGLPRPPELDGRPLSPLLAGGPGWPVTSEGDRPGVLKGGPAAMLVVRTEAAKWEIWVDPRDGTVRREQVFDLQLDPDERRPRPQEAVAHFGAAFCSAVAAERRRLRGLYGGAPPPGPCQGD